MLCPFCSITPDRMIFGSDNVVAFFDAFPITEGHALVAPRKHTESIYDLQVLEQSELWETVGKVRIALMDRFGVRSFNIGLNDGRDAGQTIAHAHIHVIPRRPGDVPDPRGGIRWIIPDKARSWS